MTLEEMKAKMARRPEPEWLRKMREHYAKTGTYRAEDLRRVLGDPTRGVEMSAKPSASKYCTG